MSELAPRCDISHSLIAEKKSIFNSPFISDVIVWAIRVCMKTCMSLCGLPIDDTRAHPSTMDPLCLCLQPKPHAIDLDPDTRELSTDQETNHLPPGIGAA